MPSNRSRTGACSGVDRVDRQLKAVICGHQTRAHVRRVVRRVEDRVHRADAARRAKRLMHTELGLIVPARLRRHGIDPDGELAAVREVGADGDVVRRGAEILHAGDAERLRLLERPFHRMPPLVLRHRRDDPEDRLHRGALQHTGRKAVGATHDRAAGRIGRVLGDPRTAERGRVRERHAAVVAHHEHRRRIGDVVDQRAGRQRGRPPRPFVPPAAEDPLAGFRPRALVDAARELGRRGGVGQIDVIQPRAAVDQTHARVVEARDQPASLGIHHRRTGSAPALDRVRAADLDDAVGDHRNRRRGRLRGVAGPDLRARDDQVSGETRRTRTANRRGAREDDRRERGAHFRSGHRRRKYSVQSWCERVAEVPGGVDPL